MIDLSIRQVFLHHISPPLSGSSFVCFHERLTVSSIQRPREVALLTVSAIFNAHYELYAQEIMAEVVGLSPSQVATLAAGGRPVDLGDEESIAHDVARELTTGHILPTSTYGVRCRF